MVQVRYLGTGEAFDHRLPNTSLVYEGARRILLDCGYSIPHRLWAVSTAPEWLDAVYLTHFHADHCFGLPPLLARMGEDGRQRPLSVFGGPGSREATNRVLETGYPGILDKLPFPLRQVELPVGEGSAFGPITLRCARSLHSLPNHAVRIEEDGLAVCYSGDGGPSPETEELFRGATLLVHEAYYPERREKTSHASVPGVIEMAQRLGVARLHALHLQRSSPRPLGVTVPHPGDVYELP